MKFHVYLLIVIGLFGFGIQPAWAENQMSPKTPTNFYYPTNSTAPSIGAYFGMRDVDGYFQSKWHCGIDLMGKLGDPVYCIANGTIVAISLNGWSDDSKRDNFAYVICHTLANGEKFIAIYGHLKLDPTFEVGSHVTAGQMLGRMGPWSYGVHLHFGIYQDQNNLTSGHYPLSGLGMQPMPRPTADIKDNVKIYGNWLDPIIFIEQRHLTKSNNIALAIIIDDSGSMCDVKLTKACQAAAGLFSRLTPDDYACLVTFSDEATLVKSMTKMTADNTVDLINAAMAIRIKNDSNITAGLVVGYDQLASMSQNYKKIAVLLSDGIHNIGPGPLDGDPSVTDRFAKAGWPIYTIGYDLGGDEIWGGNQDIVAMLNKIAENTHGTFFSATPVNVAQVFRDLIDQVCSQ